MALCTICYVFCKTEILFQNHMKKHDKEEISCVCDEWVKEFVKKDLMTNHKSKVHNKLVYKTCSQCDSHLKMYSLLKRHLWWLLKYFSKKDLLQKHIKRCQKLQVFECKNDDYKKTFGSSDSLKRHIKNPEELKVNQECQLCYFQTSSKFLLEKHKPGSNWRHFLVIASGLCGWKWKQK